MKRITPEMCLAAYEKTGAKPDKGNYGFQDEKEVLHCCGIGACYLATLPESNEFRPPKAHQWANQQFGPEYREGFVIGFDGDPERSGKCNAWNDGHADGRACAAAVFAH